MDFADYLTADHISLAPQINSKKKVLERLAEMFVLQDETLDKNTVFNKLLEREHLASTAMGGAIAIPHCRLDTLAQPIVALLRVDNGVEYDAPDGIPVKLFTALLVPEDATQQHLDLLANLASQLNNTGLVKQLLEASETSEVLKLFKGVM